MLVLTRRVGEEIVIGGLIRVRVIAAGRGRTRLGITAPDSVDILREEIHRNVQGFFGPRGASPQEASDLSQPQHPETRLS